MDFTQFEPFSFLMGGIIGLTIGTTVSYFIWKNRRTIKQAEKRLSQLQLVSVILFILYVASPLLKLPDPDPVIAIGILAMVSGEAFGTAFAKVLEKYKGNK